MQASLPFLESMTLLVCLGFSANPEYFCDTRCGSQEVLEIIPFPRMLGCAGSLMLFTLFPAFFSPVAERLISALRLSSEDRRQPRAAFEDSSFFELQSWPVRPVCSLSFLLPSRRESPPLAPSYSFCERSRSGAFGFSMSLSSIACGTSLRTFSFPPFDTTSHGPNPLPLQVGGHFPSCIISLSTPPVFLGSFRLEKMSPTSVLWLPTLLSLDPLDTLLPSHPEPASSVLTRDKVTDLSAQTTLAVPGSPDLLPRRGDFYSPGS